MGKSKPKSKEEIPPPASRSDRVKITFYADPDVKIWLDKLDSRMKSHMINQLLREGIEDGARIEDRLWVIEQRIKTIERDLKHDGFSIGAIRRVLMERFGERTTELLQKEFDDLLHGSPGGKPQRK
jgi:uncharacterized protein (UPF0335 family)